MGQAVLLMSNLQDYLAEKLRIKPESPEYYTKPLFASCVAVGTCFARTLFGN